MNRIILDYKYMKPIRDQHLLADNEAYSSIDAEVASGGLWPFRTNDFTISVPDAYATYIPKSFYRYADNKRQQWLFFDTKTDIARSAVVDDIGNACLITGIDDYPRVWTTDTLPPTATTVDGTNSYKAGLSKPPTPVVEAIDQANPGAASARTNTYRVAYLRTWDTNWNVGSGEVGSMRTDLGGMSDASGVVNVDDTHCAQIAIVHVPEYEVEEHRTHAVVYRNATGTTSADWREVIRFPLSQSGLPAGVVWQAGTGWIFIDTIADEALGEIAVNEDWFVPDALTGIIALHNGTIAGFVGNTVYLSAPYRFVFPTSQTVVTDFEIVGMGSFQNTLVICTSGNTYLCVCTDPANLLITPIQEAQSCVAKDSIVSLRDSVVYAAPYGLMRVDGNGSQHITENIIGAFRWGYYNPQSIRAASYNGNYLYYFESNILPYTGAIINMNDINVGVMGLSAKPYAIWHDDISTDVFMIMKSPTTGELNVYAFGKSYSVGKVFTWVSKKFLRNDGLVTPSAVKVNFLPEYTVIDTPKFIYEYSQACLNKPMVNVFPINGDANTWDYNIATYGSQQCQLTVYGDDEEWDRMNISSKDFYRVKSGRRFDSYYVKITSTIPIMKVQLATSAGELE